MRLYTRVHGEGPPLVLLHGLFGSNENLGGIARALSGRFTIYAMDLRNHGRSPHAEHMDYPTMAADVHDTMAAHALDGAFVLGHSMGGKTAMQLALSHPDRVERLIAVDIAPVAYDHRHDRELTAIRGLDLSAIGSRGDADAALAGAIPEATIRQFLLKNLVRSDGGFAWRIPVETIAAAYDAIAAAPVGDTPYKGPTLFVCGGASNYVPAGTETAIRAFFPSARIETVERASHWVHVQAPDAFLELVDDFLDEN